jgi:hypothetical protein
MSNEIARQRSRKGGPTSGKVGAAIKGIEWRTIEYSRHVLLYKHLLCRLPTRKVWTAKGNRSLRNCNSRKAVDYFLQVLLGSQLDNSAIRFIAEFLSTDVVKKHDELDRVNSQSTIASTRSPTKDSPTAKDQTPPRKEGYLSKRGKNFGGMQTRYFVLDSPQLRYFDAVCPPPKALPNSSQTVSTSEV